MNCQQVNKLLERYDEGDLPPQISVQVESHLKSCDSCQLKLRLVARERVCLQNTQDIPDMASDFAQKIMARITTPAQQSLPPLVPIWVEWTRRYPTVISAVAVILLFIFPMLGETNRQQELLPVPQLKQVATVEKVVNATITAPAEKPMEAQDNRGRGEDRPPANEGPSRATLTKETPGAEVSLPDMQTLAAPAADDQMVPPAVAPAYIPEGYTLDKIEIAAGNTVTVSYLAVDSPNSPPLIIKIIPNSNPDTDTEQKQGAGQREVKYEVKTLPPPSPGDVLTEAAGVYQSYSYLISSNLPLPAKEMNSLLNSLVPR